jgi:hypothetical protein
MSTITVSHRCTRKRKRLPKFRGHGSSSAILLSAIPLIFGAVRLNELANGAEITPANARFFASPLPVVLHIVGAGVYALLGAFQFVSRLWRRGTGWHRWVGRLLLSLRADRRAFRAVDDPVLSRHQ